MRVRGGFFVIFTVVVLVMGGSVLSSPPHKLYDQADMDLLSLTGLMKSSLDLCDEALNWSLGINCSVDVNDSLKVTINEFAYNSSLSAIRSIEEVLFFDFVDLYEVEEDISSYEFLQEMMVPLAVFVDNISLFILDHVQILDSFLFLGNGSYAELNGSSAQELLAGLRNLVSAARSKLNRVDEVLNEVRWDGEDRLSLKIDLLRNVLEQYDEYIGVFSGFFPEGTPLITLFVSGNDFYLFDEVEVYGYCMAGSHFLGNESVWVYLDEELYGRYQCGT